MPNAPRGAEVLRLFMPMDRRRAIAADRELPPESSGVVLMADVSGFSALTELLDEHLGPQAGAEALIHNLDRVVGGLIDEVHAYRGSVIAFAGDAITCWFEDAPDGDGADRAVSCGLAMQRVVRESPPVRVGSGSGSASEVTIELKVAGVHGRVKRFLVGDPADQRVEVLAGPVLDALERCEKVAQRGDVVVGGSLAKRLTAAPIASERAEGTVHVVAPGDPGAPTPWDADTDVDPVRAGEWALPPVVERLEQGQIDFLAQLRSTVAMFLRFDGLDYDGDPDAGEKLDAYVRWVQGILRHHGGTLLQISTGDKGSYIYGVFGALQAYGDDARRAMGAALALQKPPSDLPFVPTCRIGLSRGRLFAGAYGGSRRLTYAALGKEVNIAARLMSAAVDGETLVSDRVRALAPDAFVFRDRGALELKGHAHPCQVYALESRVARRWALPVDRSTPVFGRDGELEHLAGAIRAVSVDAPGPLLVVEGAAGAGKSRLAAALMDRMSESPVDWYIGQADPLEAAQPYAIWRDVFERLLAPDGLEVDAVRASVERLAPDQARLVPLLKDLLPLAIEDDALTSQMAGKVRADNLNALLLALLGAACRERVVAVLLEDTHWMDGASTVFLQAVAGRVPGLVVVVLTRPPESHEGSAEVPDGPTLPEAALKVGLGPLGPRAVGQLIAHRYRVRSVPDALLSWVIERTGGHPHYCEAVADALLAAGVVSVRDGHCAYAVTPGTGTLDLPDTIEGVLVGRIDQLPPAEQLTIKVASVLGPAFDLELLADVFPVEDMTGRLEDRLSALVQKGLLVDEEGVEGTFRFRQALVRELAYGMLLFQQRQRLHKAIAERLESGDVEPALLAHHWSRAARAPDFDPPAAERALHHLEAAADRAARTFANTEVVQLMAEALELDERLGSPADAGLRRARLHGRASIAYQGLGDLGRCESHGREGLAAMGRPIPDNTGLVVGWTLGQMAQRYLPRFLRAGALGDAERVRVEQEVRLYMPLARAFYHTNAPMPSLYVNAYKLNQAERMGPCPELAEALASVAITFGLFNMGARADAYFERARDVAAQTGQDGVRVLVTVIRCAYLIGHADFEQLATLLSEGRAICEALGDHDQWGDCVGIQADAALLSGDLAVARERYAELQSHADRHNNHLHELWSLRGDAVLALRRGEPEVAQATLERALLLLEGIVDQHTRIDIHGLLAVASCRRGDLEVAYAQAVLAADLIKPTQVPTAYGQYLGYAGCAETFLALQDHPTVADDLQARYRASLADLGKYAKAFPIGAPQQGRYLGLDAERSGKRAVALKHWTGALEKAVAMRLPVEEARIRALLHGVGEPGHREIARELADRLELRTLVLD
ncbi:MAG: AAA family ATPase [Myxococcota bacterium]